MANTPLNRAHDYHLADPPQGPSVCEHGRVIHKPSAQQTWLSQLSTISVTRTWRSTLVHKHGSPDHQKSPILMRVMASLASIFFSKAIKSPALSILIIIHFNFTINSLFLRNSNKYLGICWYPIVTEPQSPPLLISVDQAQIPGNTRKHIIYQLNRR